MRRSVVRRSRGFGWSRPSSWLDGVELEMATGQAAIGGSSAHPLDLHLSVLVLGPRIANCLPPDTMSPLKLMGPDERSIVTPRPGFD
jgi:hypothetical protein